MMDFMTWNEECSLSVKTEKVNKEEDPVCTSTKMSSDHDPGLDKQEEDTRDSLNHIKTDTGYPVVGMKTDINKTIVGEKLGTDTNVVITNTETNDVVISMNTDVDESLINIKTDPDAFDIKREVDHVDADVDHDEDNYCVTQSNDHDGVETSKGSENNCVTATTDRQITLCGEENHKSVGDGQCGQSVTEIDDPDDTLLVMLRDTVVPIGAMERAYKTVPEGLVIMWSEEYGKHSVFTKSFLPNGVTFGPYEGDILTTNNYR
jgi:hypothetical protein